MNGGTKSTNFFSILDSLGGLNSRGNIERCRPHTDNSLTNISGIQTTGKDKRFT